MAAITRQRLPGPDLWRAFDLIAGRVKLTPLIPAGCESILPHAKPGYTLGEFAWVDGAPRSADANAVAQPEAGCRTLRGLRGSFC